MIFNSRDATCGTNPIAPDKPEGEAVLLLSKKTIERVTIEGDYADSPAAFDWCARNGYRITRAGPADGPNGDYDATRFSIVAEKDVTKPYL